MREHFNLIVIGAGPGGYVAAIKAAKLGMKTALIEKGEIGGTCLNRGCIPTKTLMHSSRFYQEAAKLKEAGICFEGLSFDYPKILSRKDEVVMKNRQGIQGLLKANGISLLQGRAALLGPAQARGDNGKATDGNGGQGPAEKERQAGKELEQGSLHEILLITPEGEQLIYGAEKVLIATGSVPVIPRIEGVNLPGVITSDELLTEDKLYRKLLIIGGGVIGVEFATIYRDLGCEVEIIEAMDRILPNLDKELSQSLAMSLKKKGIRIHTKARVTGIRASGEFGLICDYEESERDGAKPAETTAEGILLAVGRRAYTEGLFEDGLAPQMEGACIKVNESFETSIPGVYAIGDVIKGKQLAHAASAQGIVAVERMCGKEPSVNPGVIPSCIYTSPEIAAVGLDEAEAAEQGYKVKLGKYPMLGNSKTLLSMGERGFIKVISDADSGKLLGAVLLCDRATDMVSEFTTAIVNGLTVKELAAAIRPHPTYNEAITEALEDVEGMAIHLMPSRRS
jgi:dihydrolipoamide dehydrogenase